MATIHYYAKQNMTSTATEAPYTIQVVPNGVVDDAEFKAKVAARTCVGTEFVTAVISAAVEIAVEEAANGASVDMGLVKLQPKVYGSVGYIDVPFSNVLQSYELQTFNGLQIANALNDVIPVRLSADEIASNIRICNVMDVASETFGVLDGVKDAILTGNGITMDQTGEYIKLLDKKTLAVKATCVIGTCNKGQRVKFHLPATAAIPVGDYYLEIATKGLVALEQPNIYRKPVKLISAVVPVVASTVTKVYPEGVPSETHRLSVDLNNVAEGTNLANLTKVEAFWTPSGETEESCEELTITSKSATSVLMAPVVSMLGGNNVRLKFTTSDGTCEFDNVMVEV